MIKMTLYGCKWILWLSIIITLTPYLYAQRVLCYYANWSETRNSSFRLFPRHIDISLCTHVVYAFAMPDLSEGVVPLDFLNTLNDDASNEFVALKKRRPDLLLLLSIGGWQEGSRDFSQIAADPAAVTWITEVLCQKIRNVGFDGLDINWQWPVPGLREGSNSADRENFVNLIKVMREYFDLEGLRTNRKPLLLTVVLPPFKSYADKGFDLNQIVGKVDFVNLHSMDYHVSTASEVNHLAPLFVPRPSNEPEFTVDSTVRMYIDYGIQPSMMNLGIPFYGYSYELQDPNLTDLRAPAEEEGTPGFGINTPGMLAYFEICKYVIDEKWVVKQPNQSAVGPYAYHNKNWVGYDDTEIIRKKVEYAMKKGLGGIMLMTIDMDDFNGICTERFPLTKAVTETLRSARQVPEQPVAVQEEPIGLSANNLIQPDNINYGKKSDPRKKTTPNILEGVPSANPPTQNAAVNNAPNTTIHNGPVIPEVVNPNNKPADNSSFSSPNTGLKLPNYRPENTFSPGRKVPPVPNQPFLSQMPTSTNNIVPDGPYGVIRTPGKFTLKSTRMQYNKNHYYY